MARAQFDSALDRSYIGHYASPMSGARMQVNLSTYLQIERFRQSISKKKTGNRLVEHLYCLRCNRELEPGNKSVAVYMFAQTVGIRPRQKSAAKRICFCAQCSVSLAMGPPPEGALNLSAWEMIRELVSSDPALNEAAWEALAEFTQLLPANDAEQDPRKVAGYLEF
jgi:hypothetical protein